MSRRRPRRLGAHEWSENGLFEDACGTGLVAKLYRKKFAARLAAAEAEVQWLRKQLDNPDNA